MSKAICGERAIEVFPGYRFAHPGYGFSFPFSA